MNRRQFLFGLKPHCTLAMGLSLASTWAWGVSIIVGTQVIQTKGLLAFLIWAGANAFALALFGLAAGRLPVRETLPDVMPDKVKPMYRYFTLAIQFFSVLVNITAIKTACSMLGMPNLWPVMAIGLLLIVLLKGYDANIKWDVGFILVWMAILAVIIAVMPKDAPLLVASGRRDILWALWGGAILLCGPVMDQQMWQRKVSLGGRFSLSPFLLGAGVFAVYMTLVGLLGIYGGHYPVAVAIIIICVAGSTLQSALSALSCYGRSLGSSKLLMTGCFLLAAVCLSFNLSVLTLWTLYGSVRVIPALYVFYRAWRGENGRIRTGTLPAGSQERTLPKAAC